MKRVMVIGCGGAGKTTFARNLHSITGIKLIHLDQHYWQADWVETNSADWEKKVEQLSAEEEWIIDGNYGGTMDIRLSKADTVIFINRSKWLCIYRVLYRFIKNVGRSREDMAEGCPERFTWDFIKYIYHYNNTRRPQILAKLNSLVAGQEIVVLNNSLEIKQYLLSITKN